MPNDILTGDRRHDAYPDKLRRSVEAIKDYNAGLYSDEQFAITGSLVRQTTKVKPGLVKKWMEDNSDEIQSHADQLSHGSRQNVGKLEPRFMVLMIGKMLPKPVDVERYKRHEEAWLN